MMPVWWRIDEKIISLPQLLNNYNMGNEQLKFLAETTLYFWLDWHMVTEKPEPELHVLQYGSTGNNYSTLFKRSIIFSAKWAINPTFKNQEINKSFGCRFIPEYVNYLSRPFGSRSNRPQTKSAPSQIGISQIGPRSNHCIIMVFLFNLIICP